jgi:hypothetical protein
MPVQPVQQQQARGRLAQAGQQRRQRRFAAAGSTLQQDALAVEDRQAGFAQHQIVVRRMAKYQFARIDQPGARPAASRRRRADKHAACRRRRRSEEAPDLPPGDARARQPGKSGRHARKSAPGQQHAAEPDREPDGGSAAVHEDRRQSDRMEKFSLKSRPQ